MTSRKKGIYDPENVHLKKSGYKKENPNPCFNSESGLLSRPLYYEVRIMRRV